MSLINKEDALYVKACVIANGVEDSQGDCLDAEEIKRIFTSFNNQNNFELYHDGIPVKEISLLENYINPADEALGTKTVPRGSWMSVIRVDNPDVKNKLLNNELRGVSLSNRVAARCSANLKGVVRYKDLSTIECVIPLFISFVEEGANGFPLHIFDYDTYILKSKNVKIGVSKTMTFDLLGGLKNLIKQAEDESEASILKGEDVEVKEEESSDATIVKEECPKQKEDESEIKKAEEEPEKEEEDEAEIEKAEEASEEVAEETTEEEPAEEESSDDELENKIREIIEKILAEKAEEPAEEEETAEEETDEPKITKSRKVVIENKTTESQTKNFFEMTGRDPVTGIKIRK